jgi:hypothetical protein
MPQDIPACDNHQAAEEQQVPLKEVYQEAIERGRVEIKHKG